MVRFYENLTTLDDFFWTPWCLLILQSRWDSVFLIFQTSERTEVTNDAVVINQKQQQIVVSTLLEKTLKDNRQMIFVHDSATWDATNKEVLIIQYIENMKNGDIVARKWNVWPWPQFARATPARVAASQILPKYMCIVLSIEIQIYI